MSAASPAIAHVAELDQHGRDVGQVQRAEVATDVDAVAAGVRRRRQAALDQRVPDHLGQPQRRRGDVGGPRLQLHGRDDVETVSTGGARPVRMDADLQVSSRTGRAGIARPAALVDARAPGRRRVRGPRQQHPGAEPTQHPLGQPRHLPGERRLRVAVVGRGAGGVARLAETAGVDRRVDLGREARVAELVPGSSTTTRPASGGSGSRVGAATVVLGLRGGPAAVTAAVDDPASAGSPVVRPSDPPEQPGSSSTTARPEPPRPRHGAERRAGCGAGIIGARA